MDIHRWQKMGYPARPVPNKPEVQERLSLQKNQLRDAGLFHKFYMLKAALTSLDRRHL